MWQIVKVLYTDIPAIAVDVLYLSMCANHILINKIKWVLMQCFAVCIYSLFHHESRMFLYTLLIYMYFLVPVYPQKILC